MENLLPYPWFEQADYELARQIMDDADQWPLTYEKWLALASDAIVRLNAGGCRAFKQAIDPSELERWCLDNCRAADSEARLQFAEVCWRQERW